MELERYKSAWQKHAMEGHSLSAPETVSPNLRLLRISSIRDLQRSEEWARFVFSILFALVAAGATRFALPAGAARMAAWLFALALLVDGVIGLTLLIRRFRAPATTTMMEFISREYRQVESRLRFERYSQRLMIALAATALVIMFVTPMPAGLRENALDALARMAVVTAFLAVAWRRTKSRSVEVSRELERYLKDLQA